MESKKVHSMDNLKKGLITTGECLLSFISWVCLRTAIRIMFEINVEEKDA